MSLLNLKILFHGELLWMDHIKGDPYLHENPTKITSLLSSLYDGAEPKLNSTISLLAAMLKLMEQLSKTVMPSNYMTAFFIATSTDYADFSILQSKYSNPANYTSFYSTFL